MASNGRTMRCQRRRPAAEVESRARACDWFSFAADTNWFEQVAWDIGLATIWPGRRSLAILAASDTD